MRAVKLHPRLGIALSSDGRACIRTYVGAPKGRFVWSCGSFQNNGRVCVGYLGKRYPLARLVAEAFLPNPKGLPNVTHLDGDPRNNAVSNLAWASMADIAHRRYAWRATKLGISPTEDPERYRKLSSSLSSQESHRKHPKTFRRAVKKYKATHKQVVFNDGSTHWVPLSAWASLKRLPLSERDFSSFRPSV